MADQVRETLRRQAGFAERAPHGGRGKFGIAVPYARGFQAASHFAAQMAGADPELVSDGHPAAVQRQAEARLHRSQ